jgi:hypothetical protein
MRIKKVKLEKQTDTALQITEDSTEGSIFTAADYCTEVALERKNENSKPIYLKRI